jgi:hypothetical protein
LTKSSEASGEEVLAALVGENVIGIILISLFSKEDRFIREEAEKETKTKLLTYLKIS